MEEEDFAKTRVIRGFEEVTLNYENGGDWDQKM